MRKTRKSMPGAAPGLRTRTTPAPALPIDDAAIQAEESGILDALDLGVVNASHAFQRWIHNLARDAGFPHLTVIDSVLLEQLRRRAHHKRLADICFILNTEDTHVIGYSLRKLAGLGIVDMMRHGKEVTYSIAPDHEARLVQLREIQERQLLDALSSLQIDEGSLAGLVRSLGKMSRLYDQAARAAASL